MSSRHSEQGVTAASGFIAFAVLLGIAAVLAFSRPYSQDRSQRKQPLESSRLHTAKQRDVWSAPSGRAQAGDDTLDQQTLTGRQLYLQHCAACHGDQGDGNGIAARFLFPKPRDFRMGKYRLVSTTNRIPSREDLDDVLVRGMPGSSMPPWSHLSEEQRGLLIEEIQSLTKQGARDQYIAALKEQDGLDDAEIEQVDIQREIAEFVERRTTAGSASEVPAIVAPSTDAVARGKEVYFKQSCHSCHGNEGKGDGQQKMVDDEGFPTSPRDFTLGIFKGGHDAASLYRRIAYGMPGTPMPASNQLAAGQTMDLVHYIRSLSTEELRSDAVLKRKQIVVKQVDSLPTTLDNSQWKNIDAVQLRLAPLWWRNEADPRLEVRAAHDGENISFHMSWTDNTNDSQAARSESFEDALAVELYRGNSEPFIGMGGPESPVDVWYWDADRQGTPLAVEDIYPNSVVDIYPFSEDRVSTAEADRDGARTANQPDVSLPAKASGNPIVPIGKTSSASSLAVGGLGTVTFRIPQNQLVKAEGQWNEGRWTVVMSRALKVTSADEGVSLEPGTSASAAFAVWDGSHRDRDGRKLITIWQDLLLEADGETSAIARPNLREVPQSQPTTRPPAIPIDPPRQVTQRPQPATPSVTSPVVPNGSWGTLRGRFAFDGKPPAPDPLRITKDAEVCGKHNLVDESLVVNEENRGIANIAVFLYVKRGAPTPHIHPSYVESADAEVLLDNDRCRFVPRVIVMRTTQTLSVGNKDSVGHNTKIDTLSNSGINISTPTGDTFEHQFTQVENRPATVSCSIHPWMQAWLLVRDNPYFSVSDENGVFQIENLPVGEWTFQVWHERARSISQVVREGKPEVWSRDRMTVAIQSGKNDLGEIRLSPELFR